mmetsp:Transcript_35021/g.62991  ORF Transcript_35021/g.62991 Transcript_35021/m.62991 type:complete len:83 (+) Transcript_35021:223-471(+)
MKWTFPSPPFSYSSLFPPSSLFSLPPFEVAFKIVFVDGGRRGSGKDESGATRGLQRGYSSSDILDLFFEPLNNVQIHFEERR